MSPDEARNERVAERSAAVGDTLTAAADAEAFAPLRARLAQMGIDEAGLPHALERVSHGPRDQDEILGIRARALDAPASASDARFERYALLRTAALNCGAVARLPVPDGVKHLLLDEFTWLAEPRERELRWLAAGTYEFSALCKLVTFRRFPAGQMHWEVGGLPRSTLWRARVRTLPRLLRGIRALGGFAPAFVPHLAWRRRQIVLSEVEHYRSLALMAGALELQPRIRGFVAFAWFYSPDTPATVPHLAWAPRLFQEWGGTVLVYGRAGPDSGVFDGSRRRRELAERGLFRPTIGLVIWPRSGMRHWAEHLHARPTG